MGVDRGPVGVVLAGGIGRRMGGAKLGVALGGRPLLAYPVAAMREALRDVVAIAKEDSELPALVGLEIWIEPELPRHPLIGLVTALELAGGRAVLSCPGDLPLLRSQTIRRLVLAAGSSSAPAVVAFASGRVQPLLGCFTAESSSRLRDAVARGERATDAVAALGAEPVALEDPQELFNVNTPEDLLAAARMLERQTGEG
jgi:molybdopterin-guanine dinucleotide biosynthesis protein A